MIDLDELENLAKAAREDWDGFVWQRFWDQLSEDDLLNLIERVRMAEAERDAATEVAAKAYERAILDVGLNPDLANQFLDTNPYRKAVQS